MSGKAFYELEGIRPDGSKFAGEILGEIDLAEAADLARHYAGLWGEPGAALPSAISQHQFGAGGQGRG